MTQSTVSAGLVNGMIAYASARGADKESLFERAGLCASQLTDGDNRIALDQYQQLIHAAQDLCAERAVALKWGESVDMADVSILGLIMNASGTMGEAFAQLQRYTQLAMELNEHPIKPRFVLERSANELWMVDTRENPNSFPEITETSFARLVCGPRRFLQRPHVLEVCFTHDDPGYSDEYKRIFRCPLSFNSPRNALKLHPDIASWPVAAEPDYVFGILTRHADQLLEKMKKKPTTRARVETCLMPILHKGAFTSQSVAQQLGLSRQSLYRRLKVEETSFGDIVDTLREQLATRYLKAGQTSVNETAYLLGYTDPAAFSRAYKRWTGVSPRDVA